MTFVQKANDSKIQWQSQGAWGRGMWTPPTCLWDYSCKTEDKNWGRPPVGITVHLLNQNCYLQPAKVHRFQH